ncbi:ATP-binding protein [uncultured Methanoregula sp.]|uniref:sensor histidine kinase n=1 Tax=uncultured Methanoregula sp. TaxID=1005933 RepID=UPI002AABE599|nr:ATP-binding protein [uncultured Methanoregula sp.]
MIELPLVSLDLVRSVVLNFTIIATLILLYHFVPDSILTRSRLAHPVGVGIVFGLAAALSIPAFWGDNAPVVGFNIILVPLAGFVAGPISAALVAAVLLLGSYASSGSLSSMDILTVMCGVLLGALFFEGRSWKRFPRSFRLQILLLGTGVAFIEILSAFLSSLSRNASPVAPAGIPSFSLFPFFIVSFGVTVLLGAIIGFIDRKKQAERELLAYRDHLEGLVGKRTAELKTANALQKATIESTADGIVVMDREGVIRAYNRKASLILDLPVHPHKEGDGQFLDRAAAILKDPTEFLRQARSLPESAEQIVIAGITCKNGRIYEIFVHPQQIGDRTTGRVWSFRDITDQRLAEDAIRSANNKLNLLSEITRHDIFNQLTAVTAYLELVQAENHDPSASGYLEAMKKSLEVIRFQLEFTRDYQNLGLNKPGWQSLVDAFTKAAEPFKSRNVSFCCDMERIEIFADPMIGQVFYNLIENSLRHNEMISVIRVSLMAEEPDLVILYEDDGTGVLPEEKEKIFLRGFGKHTGLGMFLIKEILSITGITVRETGTYRQGVRFEIRVPDGKFRFP